MSLLCTMALAVGLTFWGSCAIAAASPDLSAPSPPPVISPSMPPVVIEKPVTIIKEVPVPPATGTPAKQSSPASSVPLLGIFAIVALSGLCGAGLALGGAGLALIHRGLRRTNPGSFASIFIGFKFLNRACLLFPLSWAGLVGALALLLWLEG